MSITRAAALATIAAIATPRPVPPQASGAPSADDHLAGGLGFKAGDRAAGLALVSLSSDSHPHAPILVRLQAYDDLADAQLFGVATPTSMALEATGLRIVLEGLTLEPADAMARNGGIGPFSSTAARDRCASKREAIARNVVEKHRSGRRRGSRPLQCS